MAKQFRKDALGVGHGKIEYTAEELEFMRAMDDYKRKNRRPFPTWHEVLDVLLKLGYRKDKNA